MFTRFKPLVKFIIGLCLLSSLLTAASDPQLESDIAAIIAVVPPKERDGLAVFLRAPGPSGDIPSMVGQNTLNGLKDQTLAKVAEPIARRMAAHLENTGGNQRSYAFNMLLRLGDEYPAVEPVAKVAFERIAKTPGDPLVERAKKALSQTKGERLDADLERMDKAANKILIGNWLEGPEDGEPMTNRFNADGTFESVMWADAQRQRAKVTFRGKWKVLKGVLIYRVDSCSDPKVALPMPLIRDKLIQFGTSQLVYEAEDGAQVRMARLKN